MYYTEIQKIFENSTMQNLLYKKILIPKRFKMYINIL